MLLENKGDEFSFSPDNLIDMFRDASALMLRDSISTTRDAKISASDVSNAKNNFDIRNGRTQGRVNEPPSPEYLKKAGN
jgi:hypothetical protein